MVVTFSAIVMMPILVKLSLQYHFFLLSFVSYYFEVAVVVAVVEVDAVGHVFDQDVVVTPVVVEAAFEVDAVVLVLVVTGVVTDPSVEVDGHYRHDEVVDAVVVACSRAHPAAPAAAVVVAYSRADPAVAAAAAGGVHHQSYLGMKKTSFLSVYELT